MNKGFKLCVTGSLLVMCIVLGSMKNVSAAEKDTKEKALKAYENILVNDPYDDMDGGFTADSFNICDLTGDGIPELIINEEAPNIFTYKDGNIEWLYNSWVLCTMYHSEKTNNIMYYYSWDGVKVYTIYKYDEKKKKLVEVKDITYKNKTYYVNKGGKETKITKAAFNKYLAKYMPKKVKLETPYENTETNRAKFLK